MTRSFQRLLFPVLMLLAPLAALAAQPAQPPQPVAQAGHTDGAAPQKPVQNVSEAMGQRLDQMLLDRKVSPRQ